MKIKEALKGNGKAIRKGLDWFIEECQNGEYCYRIADLSTGGVLGYEISIHHILADDWQPYHEVKEIRPENAGELWKFNQYSWFTYFDKNEQNEEVLMGICNDGDISQIDKNDKVYKSINPIHGKDGWKRLFPKPEDDSNEIDQGKSALAWMRKQAQELDPSVDDDEPVGNCSRVIANSIPLEDESVERIELKNIEIESCFDDILIKTSKLDGGTVLSTTKANVIIELI